MIMLTVAVTFCAGSQLLKYRIMSVIIKKQTRNQKNSNRLRVLIVYIIEGKTQVSE